MGFILDSHFTQADTEWQMLFQLCGTSRTFVGMDPYCSHDWRDRVPISAAPTLEILLEAAIADGIRNNSPPAPGILDVMDTCDLFNLRPQALSLQGLLEFVDPERKIQDATPQALGRWINNDMALDFLEPLTDSWFEDSQETRKVIANAKTRRSAEIGIWKYLESRRDLWAKRFLQTAAMLRDADRPREWQTLTASAYGLMNNRPLKRIPVMEDIVELTIDAAYDAMW